jgi:hypothetical protein
LVSRYGAEPFDQWGGFSCDLKKEMIMKSLRPFGMTFLAASISLSALGLMTSGTWAQQAQPAETTPSQQDSHSGGTAPHGIGSTGWTGGTGGSHIGTSNSLTTGSAPREDSSDSAKDQPEMATGEDLKGPPTRFPANKTPE